MSDAVLRAAFLAAPLLLGACQGGGADRPIMVDAIGPAGAIDGRSKDERGAVTDVIAGATAQGLVSYDAQGEITDAMAESWIVADAGRSYIFRLKRLDWSNGQPVRAAEVAELLRARMKAAPDILARLDPQVRAMTERVIEIRLDAAVPSFLQLIAHPRLSIARARTGIGTGPYAATARLGRLYLSPPPDSADEDSDAGALRARDRRTLEASRPALAIVRFQAGQTELVLGGRFQDLPLLGAAGSIRPASIRADPSPGLFGLRFAGTSDFLADTQVRTAIAQAVDRDGIASALNLAGWTVTDRLLPAQLDLGRLPSAPAWSGIDLAQRQSNARGVIERWTAGHGVAPVVRVALPAGPGATLLFLRLAADLSRIGIRIDRVGENEPADLKLIDEVAPFDSALWYLSRLSCDQGPGCNPIAQEALAQARATGNETERARLLGEAEALILAGGGYVPLGLPIRWSLVARRLTGFQPSPRAVHPLNRLIATLN